MAAMVLAACTSVRLDQPTPAPSAPRAVDADRYPPPQLRAPPAQPIEPTPLPLPPPARAEAITPPPPAAAIPLPTPVPASPESPSPAPLSPPVATRPDPAPAPPATPSALAPSPAAAGATSASASVPEALAPGRWSVQAGVFMVVQNAQALRARLDQRLANSGLAPGDRALRIARRDGRLHVVIGDQPDRAGAIKLATLLREVLQQDVTLFAW
jgi:hypothetical protein